MELLSTQEAAKIWGYSRRWIAEKCRQGLFSEDEAVLIADRWLVTKAGMERVFGPPGVSKKQWEETYRPNKNAPE